MPERKARVVIIFSLALLILQTKEPLAAAENLKNALSTGLSDKQLCEILVAIAKVDSKLKVVWTPEFSIESGDLKINVKADNPTLYDGKPYQNSSPQTGLYGQVNVSDKFYGVELILHYLLLRANTPFGNAPIQERVTVLYEDLPRFKPVHPRAFDSRPFAVSRDGIFQDRQAFGQFDVPLPEKTVQILKQELILDNELIATIYIVRTPREIRLVG